MRDKYELREKQDAICDERDGDIEDPILQAKDETLGFLLGDMDSPAEAISEPPTTDEEIDKLIEAVRDEYKDLPEFSMFGDPNWEIRDAIIRILEWAKGGD